MIHSGLISGSIEQALYRDATGLWLIAAPGAEPRPAETRDVAAFRNIAFEVCDAVPDGLPITFEALTEKFDREVKFSQALRGLLMGMDPGLSEGLRRKSIVRANALLLDAPPFEASLEQRFLVPANTQEWSPGEGLRLAEELGASRAAELYRLIADGVIDRVVDELAHAVMNVHGSGVKAKEVRDDFLKGGIVGRVSKLVGLGDVKGLRALAFDFRKIPEVAHLDPNGRVLIPIIQHFVQSIEVAGQGHAKPQSQLAAAPRNQLSNPDISPLRAAVSEFLEEWEKRRRKGKANEYIEVSSVQREVDWIAGKIRSNKIPAARSALAELVKRQSGASNPAHVTKTFTSVAVHAREARQFDFCFEVLDLVDLMEARDAHAASIRGGALQDLGYDQDALAIFKDAAARFPNNPVTQCEYAEQLRETGHYREAQDVFEQAMARFPDDEVPRNACAKLLGEMGNYPQAARLFEETIERFPHDAVAPTAYAELLRELGRYSEAIALFEETRARFPNNAVTPAGYAGLLREMGRYEEAIEVCKETMTRFEDCVVVRNCYAEILREMGRYAEAIVVFEETLGRFQNDCVVRNAYAQLLISIGRYEDAKGLLLQSSTRLLTKGDWVALHALGMCYLRCGEVQKGLEIFERGKSCPFVKSIRYFRSGCAMARLALKDPNRAKSEIEGISTGSGEFNRAVDLLDAHISGDLGETQNVRSILSSVSSGYLDQNEKSLVGALRERYLLNAISSSDLAAANDNLLALETIVIFKAINKDSGIMLAA